MSSEENIEETLLYSYKVMDGENALQRNDLVLNLTVGWLQEGGSPTYPSAATLRRTLVHPEDTDVLTLTVQADLGKGGSTAGIYVRLQTHTRICVLKNRGMDEEGVAHTHSGLLLSHEKE